RRVQRDVSQQIEYQARLVAQRIDRDRQEIGPRGRRQRAADAFNRRRDLLRGPRVRSLGEQLRRELRQPFLAGLVVNPARAERKAHRNDRLLVALDHHELQPVRECCLLEGREVSGRETSRLRRRGGKSLGGKAVGRNGGKHRCQTYRRTAIPPSRRHCAPLSTAPAPAPAPAGGFTRTTTAFAGSRYFPATRRMSSPVSTI